ncbi:hypothetical protein F4604DRAFT_1653983 [Suillus subluteus]|nr:hypothetical protein F4604DRAFT_1653983 [Suillus subluteus]
MPDFETHSQFSSTNHYDNDINDQSLITTNITERQQRLDAVSHEISDLETVMDNMQNIHRQLIKKKDKITQSINFHKRLVLTLWHLPTEILSQIFHHCLLEFEFDSLSYISKLAAPLLLITICRQWRDVVIGMPSLWCSLS